MAWGGALALLALAPLAEARSATLVRQARLRAGPSAATEQLGWVPEGTRVEVLGESAGWRQVQSPDGKTGYLWGEHLAEGEAQPAAEPARRQEAPAPAVRPPEDERPAPAIAAEIERLRVEVERLTAAQRELYRRLEDRALATAAPAPPSLESTPGVAVALLLIGGGIGFLASRLVQRRRDRRQWTRLRV